MLLFFSVLLRYWWLGYLSSWLIEFLLIKDCFWISYAKQYQFLNGKIPFSTLEISLMPVHCCQSLGRVQLCDPGDRCTPSFPVLHCLLEPAQTHDSCSCHCINYFTLVIKMFISPHVYDFINYRFKSLI